MSDQSGSGGKVSGVYGSQYLRAVDINGKTHEGQIIEAGIEKVTSPDKGGRPRVVIRLDTIPKALVLNATNAKAIAETYGDEIDGWLGKYVKVSTRKVRFGNGLVDGLLIEPVKQ